MEQTAQPKPERRQRIFSGIQPTGIDDPGQLPRRDQKLGRACRMITTASTRVVNMHAITVRQDPPGPAPTTPSPCLRPVHGLRHRPGEVACSSSRAMSTTHAELAWVLDCYTQFGELSRMTQFKDKSAKHADNVNAGLFTYPVLMAADILLYQTDLVPVGMDQKQHLELARNIAQRLQRRCTATPLPCPTAISPRLAAKVMSLQEPDQEDEQERRQPQGFYRHPRQARDASSRSFRSAVTDSEAEVVCREGKDGINNLMAIYSAVTGRRLSRRSRRSSPDAATATSKPPSAKRSQRPSAPCASSSTAIWPTRPSSRNVTGRAPRAPRRFPSGRWIRSIRKLGFWRNRFF